MSEKIEEICKCIICHNLKPVSEEHIIPDAIGGNLKIYNVCSMCNSQMGDAIDCLMTDDDFIKYLRWQYQVKNRDNKTVDIFNAKYGWKDNEAIKVILKKHENSVGNIIYDGTQNPEVKIERLGSSEEFNVTLIQGSDYNSIIQKIKREFKKIGYDRSIEDIKKQVPASSIKGSVQKTLAKHELSIQWFNYLPCVIKIAYEYALSRLGEKYASDIYAIIFREYLVIQKEVPTDIPEQIAIECIYNYYEMTNKHTIYFEMNNNKVVINIQLFGCLLFKVKISDSYDQYVDILSEINSFQIII